MYKILTILFLASSSFYTQAQQWINCTNGNQANDIVVDGDVLWIGTDGGLVRYDQLSEEKTFFNRSNANIPNNKVLSMVLDDENRIWISSGSFYNSIIGIAYYDGDTWTRIDSISGILGKANNGDILVASSNKLYRFDGENFTSVDIPAACAIPTGIAVSPINGDIWMTFYGFGCYNVVRYDGTSFEIFDNQNSSLPFESPSKNSIYIDEIGKVWIGAWGGIYIFDGNDWTIQNEGNTGLPSGLVTSIKEDDNGVVWVGLETYYQPDSTLMGLASFDGLNWTAYELPPEYKYANQVNLALPLGDEILLATNDGFFNYDLESFESVSTSNSALVSNTINSILHHGGDTWVGAGDNTPYNYTGVAKINGENWTFFDIENDPFTENTGIKVMDVDGEGQVYVQNGNQIYFYDGVDWTLFEIPDLVEDVTESHAELRFDENNQPWLFNYYGYIFRYTGTEWIIFEPSDHGSVNGTYLGIDFDESTNDLWFGSYGGLYHFDGSNWTNYTDFGLNNNNAYVNGVKIDADGNVWLALNNGISKFDGNSFTPYTSNEMGLPGNHVFRSIEIDEAGHIWAGAYNVLVEFDGQNWEVYDTGNSGLPNGTITALAEDENQNMWIGTRGGGFVIFNENGIEGFGEHTKTEEQFEVLPLIVYPTLINTKSTIYIDVPSTNAARFAQLSLIDTFGKQVYQNQVFLNQEKISINLAEIQLSSGVYFVSLVVDEKRYVGKVVVVKED